MNRTLRSLSTRAPSNLTILKDYHDGKETGVVTLFLNNPKALNALTAPMGLEFTKIIQDLNAANNTKCLILTGTGDAFSAGGDVKWLQERTETAPIENSNIMKSFYQSFIVQLLSAKFPTIAAVNGVAVGAGSALILGCDYRIASRNAKAAFNFVKLGIPPGMGSTHFLPKLIGHQNASRLLLTGEMIDSETASRMGLWEVLQDQDALSSSLTMARQIAATSSVASKLLLKNLRSHTNLDSYLQREADSQAIAFASQDIKEGLRAIIEKRRPKFAS